jgi:glycosyltransferase involved in cell wall biosynthesis
VPADDERVTDVRPTVSVALCTHNGERFIREQLRSILDQSVPPTQLVLSDDASTDSTVAVALAVIDDHRRTHPDHALVVDLIENSPALGVVKNFEGAILACTGDLIALSDQDDRWSDDRLERMTRAFAERPGLLLLHTDARLVDENGTPLAASLFEALGIGRATRDAVHRGDGFDVLMHRNIVTGATTMFRRALVASAVPFPADWVHDEWLAIVAALGDGIDLLEEPLLDYRQHGSNEIGAAKLSIAGKFGRMIEPGARRNARLLARAEQLEARVDHLTTVAARISAVQEKARHERMRAALPVQRWRRLSSVVRGLALGRYGRFGRGPSDAVRDLLQPLDGSP